MISADTTVARLLDENPQLAEVLAGYHPHFNQLRNRLLRRVMAPRVTVAQAARMAGVPPDELLAVLRRAVGAGSPEGRGRSLEAPSPFQGESRGEGGKPRVLVDVSEARRVHLDVRVGKIPSVEDVQVAIVFDPPWTPDRIRQDALP